MILDGSKSTRLTVVVQFVEFWTEFKQSILDSISAEASRSNLNQRQMQVEFDNQC